MNFQMILMPKVIWAKFSSQKIDSLLTFLSKACFSNFKGNQKPTLTKAKR